LNSYLSYHFASLAKSINPEILTVWGGTNYPFKRSEPLLMDLLQNELEKGSVEGGFNFVVLRKQ
jgi:hypothetical protein